MRLIDAEKLDEARIDYIISGYANSPEDCAEFGMMIIKAPTVCDIDCAIKSEGYMRGVNDDRNLWEHRIKQIRADIESARYGLINDGLDVALRIIDKYTRGE